MIRAALVLTCLASPAAAEVFPAFHAVTGVAADDVLNIRAAPSAGSETIGALPPDATEVEVLAIAGGWATVNAGEGTGYVAARFLTRAAGPDWTALETPLTCLGTEPFWSLAVDPVAGSAVLSRPDGGDTAYSLGRGYPGSALFPVAGLPVSGGRMLLLAARPCSDGMSDRAFGIGASFHPPGPDEGVLTGCCSLAAVAP